MTPMMKQFHELKSKHPEALLMFRCGDFYEMYEDDAVTASGILGIILTESNSGQGRDGKPIRMAGFPHHALDSYLPRLVRAGKHVAICTQLEDPRPMKTVRQSITERLKLKSAEQ